MDSLLVALVFALAISSVGAIKCYKCGDILRVNSTEDCLDNFKAGNSSTMETCEGAVCLKTKIIMLGLVQLVQRHCGEKDVTNSLEYSEYKCRTSKEPMTYCACNTPFCNGASSVSVSISFLVTACLAVLVKCSLW
ncbi:hypothetical protein NP493_42g08046 [Ridgeia piscesae]|uniref:Protein sleepless n=1 Tax=Ridgeia piscesae TaxID=27915 RepID=A0AAD9PC26_RIDPI|nr:hypothetical protein NP493_42g08046 [Ridgeia piscesae]